MPTAPAPLLTLLGLLLSFLMLAWCSRQISRQIQIVVAYLTGSIDLATLVFFLLLLPGVIMHEAAHWVTAYGLGLKPSRFRVWPKTQGRFIQLGSVKVRRGNLWQDNLVGLAPLLIGSILIALIGQHIFFASELATAFLKGNCRAAWQGFVTTLSTSDGPLWAYLLFVIGNAMMPSASDRESLRPLLWYIALAALLYVVIGLPLGPVAAMLDWLRPTLTDLTNAFSFTIILDGVILLMLAVLQLFIRPPAQPLIKKRKAKAVSNR